MGAAELGVLGFLLLVLFGVKKTGKKDGTSDEKTSSDDKVASEDSEDKSEDA